MNNPPPNYAKDMAQWVADLTGRTVAYVPIEKMPSTKLPTTEAEIQESIDDFMDCLGPIVRVEPTNE